VKRAIGAPAQAVPVHAQISTTGAAAASNVAGLAVGIT
jgi:hypothetical protein